VLRIGLSALRIDRSLCLKSSVREKVRISGPLLVIKIICNRPYIYVLYICLKYIYCNYNKELCYIFRCASHKKLNVCMRRMRNIFLRLVKVKLSLCLSN
jgi:hypothetical protein